MEPLETLPDTKQTTPSTPKSTPFSHNSTPPNLRSIQNPYQNNTNYHSRQQLHTWLQEALKPQTHTTNTPSPTQSPRNTTILTRIPMLSHMRQHNAEGLVSGIWAMSKGYNSVYSYSSTSEPIQPQAKHTKSSSNNTNYTPALAIQY